MTTNILNLALSWFYKEASFTESVAPYFFTRNFRPDRPRLVLAVNKALKIKVPFRTLT